MGDWFTDFWTWWKRLNGWSSVPAAIAAAGLQAVAVSTPSVPVRVVGVSAVATKVREKVKVHVSVSPIRSDVKRGPKGWLALLAQHGGMCQFYELHYIRKHLHVSPINCLHWNRWENNGDLDVDYSRSTLMCNHFAETQSPAWDYMAPVLWNERTGPTQHQWWYAASVAADKNSGSPMEIDSYASRRPYPNEGDPKIGGRLGDLGDARHVWELRPAEVVRRWYDRTADLSHATKGRTRQAADELLESVMENHFSVPKAFNRDDGTRAEWSMRMIRWLDTAQWMTWACEMARLHHEEGRGRECPGWWATHCNAWGIAVPDFSMQKKRPTYAERARAKEDRAYYALELEGMSWDYWTAIAKAVIRSASYPGAPDFLGQQIAAPGAWRNVFDMPDDCGALRPPPFLVQGHISSGLLMEWSREQNFKTGWQTAVEVWDAVGKTVLSFVNVAELDAALAVMTESLAVVTQIIQCAYNLANGGKFSVDDLSDVLQNIYNLTTKVAAQTGADVSDVVPDGTWEALTTAGATIKGWGGGLEDVVRERAEALRIDLLKIRDTLHWDYLDEGFSTLVCSRPIA